MKVTPMGAAGTVTGSCFIIETEHSRFAVDCGMHQGNTEIEKRNRNTSEYKASELDFILLTHAHIDHSGLLPRMAKENFTGPVYCTEPTLELLAIMLLDSAHIQEMEAQWASRKLARRGFDGIDPLYTEEDALKVTKQFKPLRYNECFQPADGISVCYRDAGHILGSAFLELEVQEKGKIIRVIFSGDLGRPDALIVEDPQTPLLQADYLFLESTYGDRNHKSEKTSLDELALAIQSSYDNNQKTIIPAFAVERTQEIIYTLFLLRKAGKLPDIPIYVDSPLAIKATKIFRNHPSYFDRETLELIEKGEDPLSLPGLKYTNTAEESKAINERPGPGIIISASGMCNAGRIKHHLRHNLWRKGASIVFVGYQAVGTPGRKIVDGAKSINILGDNVVVQANIFTIGGFSGHAGQSQILDWLGHMAKHKPQVFLIHGEEKAQEILSGLIRERYKLNVSITAYHKTVQLIPGEAPVTFTAADAMPQPVNWNALLSQADSNLVQLKTLLAGIDRQDVAMQAEIQDNIKNINRQITDFLSSISHK